MYMLFLLINSTSLKIRRLAKLAAQVLEAKLQQCHHPRRRVETVVRRCETSDVNSPWSMFSNASPPCLYFLHHSLDRLSPRNLTVSHTSSHHLISVSKGYPMLIHIEPGLHHHSLRLVHCQRPLSCLLWRWRTTTHGSQRTSLECPSRTRCTAYDDNLTYWNGRFVNVLKCNENILKASGSIWKLCGSWELN